MSNNEKKSIRICPRCHGHNGDCAHCGGSGADDSREELNIVGAQKKDMAQSKPKRPAEKDDDSRVAVHEQAERVEAFHVRDEEEHPHYRTSDTWRMLYFEPYRASNMAFAP